MKVISQYEVNKLNAGPKAKVDVEKILQKKYAASTKSLKIKNNIHNSKLNLFIFRLKKFFFILRNKNIMDVTVFQLPVNKNRKINIKSKKIIGLIHDIDGLRDMNDTLLQKEIEQYNKFNVIISHNDIMTNFLIKKGVNTPIINLEMFDYLISSDIKNKKEKSKKSNKSKTIVFAGNLSKAVFLNELEEEKMEFNINLYGVGKYNEDNKKMCYFGSYSPDELPLIMDGDLGLVWDGSVVVDENSNNNFLNYTKYNNPHKLSCYIAAGLPVIVWEKAACSKFVIENDIGYVISNIYDINSLNFEDYDIKKKNVKKVRKKVISGYYTVKAIDSALKIIEENE